jgi:hypothetical protein
MQSDLVRQVRVAISQHDFSLTVGLPVPYIKYAAVHCMLHDLGVAGKGLFNAGQLAKVSFGLHQSGFVRGGNSGHVTQAEDASDS